MIKFRKVTASRVLAVVTDIGHHCYDKCDMVARGTRVRSVEEHLLCFPFGTSGRIQWPEKDLHGALMSKQPNFVLGDHWKAQDRILISDIFTGLSP